MVLTHGSHSHSQELTAWFQCNMCGGSFPSVNEYLKHKQTLHSAQFPISENATNNIIVFEEIISNQEGTFNFDCSLNRKLVILVLHRRYNYPFLSDISLFTGNGNIIQKSKLMTSGTRDDAQNHRRHPESQSLRLLQADSSESDLTQIQTPNTDPEKTVQLAIVSSKDCDSAKMSRNQKSPIRATVNAPEAVTETFQNAQNTNSETGIARELINQETKSEPAFSRIRQIQSTTDSFKISKIPPNPYVLVKRLKLKEITVEKGSESQPKISNKKMKPKNFNCPHPRCILSFQSEFLAVRHFKIVHAKVKTFKCTHPGCPKWFSTKSNCQNHAVEHTSKRYTCEVCQKKFVYKCSLKTHYLLLHTPTTKMYECTFSGCNKSFMTKGSLKLHFPVHADARSRPTFECKLCKKQMLRKPHLRQHYLKYHGQSSLTNFYAPAPWTATMGP